MRISDCGLKSVRYQSKIRNPKSAIRTPEDMEMPRTNKHIAALDIGTTEVRAIVGRHFLQLLEQEGERLVGWSEPVDDPSEVISSKQPFENIGRLLAHAASA